MSSITSTICNRWVNRLGLVHAHHHHDYIEKVSAIGPGKPSSKSITIYAVMILVGFGSFAYFAFVSDQPRIGWISYLHNLYFFTGLSAAGVVIAAILQVTNAMWGRPIKRFAEATGSFLPFAIGGLILFWIGADTIYEWIQYPPHGGNKEFWLTKPFMFVRVIGGLLLLTWLGKYFTNHSLRPDLGLAHEHNSPAHWRGIEEERARSQGRQSLIAPFYCLAFAVVCSLLAYDLIMSLDYRWFSTMFGGWNFTTNILLGFGFLYYLTHFISKRFDLDLYMSRPLYHDIGKLAFGFTVVWGYLFFAQYLVIWYGNLSFEAGYLLTRFEGLPWKYFSYVAFAMVFLLPFILGLSKQRKMSFATYAPVATISIMGVWIERFVLIAPAAWYFDHEKMAFMPGVSNLVIADVLTFIGFLGLFLWVYTAYLFKRPLMVISDPRLDLGINRH